MSGRFSMSLLLAILSLLVAGPSSELLAQD